MSLLEILLALTLLVVGFLAVAGLFSSNLQLINRSSELTEASEIAREVLEVMKAYPETVPGPPMRFTPNSPVLPGTPPFPPPPFPTVDGENGRYEITVNITNAPVDDLKAVEVQVSWDGGQGVRIQTLLPE